MATVGFLGKSLVREDEDDKKSRRGDLNNIEIMSSLRKAEGWTNEHTYEYEGFWYISATTIEGVMWMQQKFKPRPADVLLATLPKSGTTWFKSLMFAVMNRSTHFDFSTHPLLSANPHDLVLWLENYLLQNIPFPDPDTFHPPQLFHTHCPFTSLSQYVRESQCRIVYVSRNPKDVFVSTYYFLQKVRDQKGVPPISLEKAFELFCKGISLLGPLWDHVLGYWKASLEMPERVMFIKYEDMKRDPLFHLKRLAEFMGFPFSVEEEKQGVVHDILQICSIENLRNLEVNKTGEIIASSLRFQKHTFFRKGEVGDWKRHLTDEMADRLNKLIEQKLAGSGLTFEDDSQA